MEQRHPILEFSGSICENVVANLTERTQNFTYGDGFETAVNSTLSALVARQSALAIGMAESPPNWSGHIAPLILRPMIDLLIMVRWILRDPVVRSKEYINYGLGMEKLLTANYQAAELKDEEGKDVAQIVKANLAWIESQQFQMFVTVNLGSWTGMSVRKMCDEIGDPDLYKFSYTPFSSCVHNTWNHVGKWNAKTCKNPLHKQHVVGTIIDVWPIIDFVMRSTKYLALTLDEFDAYYDFRAASMSPIEAFSQALHRLPDE